MMNNAFRPNSKTKIQKGDTLLVFGDKKGLSETSKILTDFEADIDNLLIPS